MIVITQGDSAILQLTAQDKDANPVPLTTATDFTTYMKGPNGVIVEFDNEQHEIVDAAAGIYSLTLSSDDTGSIGLGLHKEIITRIVFSGGSTVYFHGFNVLTVLANVPLQ